MNYITYLLGAVIQSKTARIRRPAPPPCGVWVVHRILIKLLLSYRLASDGTFGVVVVNGVPGEQLAQLAAGCLDGVCLALCAQFLELG